MLDGSIGEIDRKLVRGLYKYAKTWEELRQINTQQNQALQMIMDAGAGGIWFSSNRDTVIDSGASQVYNNQDTLFEDMKRQLATLIAIGTKIEKELVDETSRLISRVILYLLHWADTTLTLFRRTTSFLSMKHIALETKMRVLKD